MIPISYSAAAGILTLLWLLVRFAVYRKRGRLCWQRETQLLLVYICLVVVLRFTFFPFEKVDGKLQPLIFDAANALPFRINLIPFVHLMAYPDRRSALLNLVGNTAMFIPLGIIWPWVFPQLNTHIKAMAAGIGVSLTIELLQLPFHARVTDIDDLMLNSLGYFLGYLLCLLVRRLKTGTTK